MSAGARLLLLLVQLTAMALIAADLDVTILHTNDMHGRFDETSPNSGTCKTPSAQCYGGFARVAHVVRTHRNASARDPHVPATLFLNAGDTYTGTSWFSVHKWKIAVDFINRLAPDCISFGNHEFDYGIAGILPFVENLKVPLVAANMDFSKEKDFTAEVPKSHILTVRGTRIGIIGYLIPDTAILSSTGNVIFLDEVDSINEEAKRLYEDGVRVIIALGHSGFEIDKKIAMECPLVDLVIGGHTNTFLWNGEQPDSEPIEGPYPTLITQPSGRVVPVVQAYAYTKYIGRLNITINEDGELTRYEGQPILLTGDIPKEKDIDQALDSYRPGLEAATKTIVGRTKVDLLINDCRLKECNFGNLLADAMVEYAAFNYVGEGWTDTAIAVVNGGNFRASIDIGEFSNGDLLGSLPYEMDLIAFNLKGSDVRTMLETSIRSNGETSRGEFLQMSGLHVTYDVDQPVGNRVVEVAARCASCKVPTYAPLKDEQTYRFISNQFLMSGGDGYTVLKDNAFNRTVQDTSEIELLTSYIQRRQIIYPEVGGRIRFVGKPTSQLTPTSSATRSISANWILVLVFWISMIKSRGV